MTAQPPPFFIELKSPRYLLRTLAPSDAGPSLEVWTLDPLAAEMMNAQLQRWDIGRQHAYIASFQNRKDKHLLGMFPLGTASPVGLYILRFNQPNGTFVISNMIGDKAWRGNGSSAECSDAIYDYLFNTLGYSKAKANVRPQNKAMLWLMLNSAWKRECKLKQHLRDIETKERSDIYTFGLLAREWQAFYEKTVSNAGQPKVSSPR